MTKKQTKFNGRIQNTELFKNYVKHMITSGNYYSHIFSWFFNEDNKLRNYNRLNTIGRINPDKIHRRNIIRK